MNKKMALLAVICAYMAGTPAWAENNDGDSIDVCLKLMFSNRRYYTGRGNVTYDVWINGQRAVLDTETACFTQRIAVTDAPVNVKVVCNGKVWLDGWRNVGTSGRLGAYLVDNDREIRKYHDNISRAVVAQECRGVRGFRVRKIDNCWKCVPTRRHERMQRRDKTR